MEERNTAISKNGRDVKGEGMKTVINRGNITHPAHHGAVIIG